MTRTGASGGREGTADTAAARSDWPAEVHAVLSRVGVRQVGHVPDAGHIRLIELCGADPEMRCVTLTTEEEGIGLVAGAWLGGQRGVLLMQSSGVGNCVNAFSLLQNCRFPFLAIVTMRGEWGEFNPWQVPMGRTARPIMEMAGLIVHDVRAPEAVADTVAAAADLAFNGYQAVAVTLSQALLGAKAFAE